MVCFATASARSCSAAPAEPLLPDRRGGELAMKASRACVLWGILILVAAAPVAGSGFSVYEQSAKASGQAGAWVARADDAGANWYNPAGLVRLEGLELQLGASVITIGRDTRFEDRDPAWNVPYDVPTPTKFDAGENDTTPAHLYFSHRVADRLAWGIGINTPYGLITEWKDRPVVFSSSKAELTSFVVNPNIAYAVDDHWSVALGADFLSVDIRQFSRVIDESTLLAAPPGTVVGQSRLKGDGTAWGFNVAALAKYPAWSVGLTYRSSLSPDIDGDVAFNGIVPALRTLFPDSPATAKLDLPAQAAVGVCYGGFANWKLEFDVSWAQWSRFRRLAVDIEKNTFVPNVQDPELPPIPIVRDIDQAENWHDTFAFRIGSAWTVADRHELRFGALYDRGPIPDSTLRPSIPDAARWSATLGYGFAAKRWGVDVYYMPLFFDDATAHGDPARKPSANPYVEPDGVIDGRYSSFVHLFGVTLHFRF